VDSSRSSQSNNSSSSSSSSGDESNNRSSSSSRRSRSDGGSIRKARFVELRFVQKADHSLVEGLKLGQDWLQGSIGGVPCNPHGQFTSKNEAIP